VSFTSYAYLLFFAGVFACYWVVRKRSVQNVLLLAASYFFFGFVHPWFCLLLAASNVTDYFCALGIRRHAGFRKLFLTISVSANLAVLGFFKYFNFFSENFRHAAGLIGIQLDAVTLNIILPVGISFYTFKSISYVVDVFRGKIEPRRNIIDFALYVAFFPELAAGPIDRARDLLPQIEKERRWKWDMFFSAWPLLLSGYVKKMVIADNIAVYVNKIFLLEQPSFFILLTGGVAFTVQILADFSGYTDMARGFGKLLGFDLAENFRSPYLAVSPSDFWRRWHITFSTWIRDYVYIPLGGSRVDTRLKFAAVLVVTLGLSGLWHGADWNFIVWGIYHGVLLFIYHSLGMGGRWVPRTWIKKTTACFVMFVLAAIGWTIFRAPGMDWLVRVLLSGGMQPGFEEDSLAAGLVVLSFTLIYSLPLFILLFISRFVPDRKWAHSLIHAAFVILLIVFFQDSRQDFIYFQF